MPTPQPGIFGIGTRQQYHLQFDIGGEPGALIDTVRRVREGAGTVAGVSVVVGLGPDFMASVSPDDMPADFESSGSIEGVDGFTIPETQHDLWIWLHGAGQDAVLDVARSAVDELSAVASLVSEQQSFAYRSSRDLTGFEDGTENPAIDEALEAATLPDGESGAGGIRSHPQVSGFLATGLCPAATLQWPQLEVGELNRHEAVLIGYRRTARSRMGSGERRRNR